MKKTTIIFYLIFLIISHSNAQQQSEGIRFLMNQPFDKIKKTAAENNKNIFVDCFATWCGPCKALTKKTFPLKDVGDFFNSQFINVTYDVEKGNGIEFAEQYKDYIPGLPTMLLITPTGKVIHSIVGFREGDQLIAEMKNALEGKTLSALEQRYQSGEREIGFIKDYVAALQGAYKKNEVKKVVEDYISNLPVESLLDADIWSIAGEFITNPYDNSFLFVIKNILKYEFVLKENTAAIQRQLSRGMRKAIDKILPQAQKQDCPTSTLDSINVLKEVLNENVLQESYAWLGKLKIAEYQRNNKPQEVFNFISFAQTINMYKKDYGYLKDVYEYLAEHIHNPKMLKVCLDNVTRLQNSENKTSLSLNYYGIISRLNKKLGNEDVAKTAKEKYEELEKINKAKVQKFYESLMKK